MKRTMNNLELNYLIKCKPNLTETNEKIQYVTSVALYKRGWKSVGKLASGVYTKNDFILTLYKATVRDDVTSASTFVSPVAVQVFCNLANTTWVLERYNKIYGSGKMQVFWENIFDKLEDMDEYDSFIEFIEKIDKIANSSNLELASMGQMYKSILDDDGYSYTISDNSITETRLFYSSLDFWEIKAACVYQILTIITDDPDYGQALLIQRVYPHKENEISMPASLFVNAMNTGAIIATKRMTGVEDDRSLIDATGTEMAGLPVAIQKLNFSLKKQEILGQAIKENLYILPLLLSTDENLQDVLAITRSCNETRLLLQLPQDTEMLKVIVEFARAGYSIWQPLQETKATDAKFILTELLENAGYQKQEMVSEYGAATADLMNYMQTSFLSCEPAKGIRANFLYLQALKKVQILQNLCDCLMSEAMTDNNNNRLLLHTVYTTNTAKNEIRSFFYEEGLEDLLEKVLKEYLYVTFDWRHGFGLDCKRYAIERVAAGYRVYDNKHNIVGYYLKVNGEVFSYGDFSCMK